MYRVTIQKLTVRYTATFAGVSILYRGGGAVFVGASCDQFAGGHPANSHVLIGAFASFAATANNFCSFDRVYFFHL